MLGGKGIWRLSLRHLLHHRGRSAILVFCVALVVFLPWVASGLLQQYERDLRARAGATPLLAGARTTPIGLTLGALYFRRDGGPVLAYGDAMAWGRDGLAVPIPLNVRFTARGHPVVATTPEYAELRQLRPAAGTLPLRLGDVALGADVAAALDLAAGDALFTDPTDLYDLAVPPSLKLRVVGVLEPTGGADDRAAFVDIKTAWILEGKAHGHEDVRAMAADDIQARQGDVVAVHPKAFEYYEVTDDNVASFHHHGDEAGYPLTAAILVPRDAKAGTILKARINGGSQHLAVRPDEVVDELLDGVFRVKRLFDLVTVTMAVVTALLLGLQVLLSLRLREGEVRTLRRIGAPPGAVAWLHGSELLLVVGAGVALAWAGASIAHAAAPDFIKLWSAL